MRQLVSGALLGACLVAVPPAVGPDVEHRAVDAFEDLWQQISNYFQAAALFGILIFGGVVVNVAQFFADAYDWVAGICGFEPVGVMAALVAEPAVASDLSTDLGDITVLVSGLIP